jgi:hypothetical protein
MKDTATRATSSAVTAPPTSIPGLPSKHATSSPDPNTTYGQLHRRREIPCESFRTEPSTVKPQPTPPSPRQTGPLSMEESELRALAAGDRVRMERRKRGGVISDKELRELASAAGERFNRYRQKRSLPPLPGPSTKAEEDFRVRMMVANDAYLTSEFTRRGKGSEKSTSSVPAYIPAEVAAIRESFTRRDSRTNEEIDEDARTLELEPWEQQREEKAKMLWEEERNSWFSKKARADAKTDQRQTASSPSGTNDHDALALRPKETDKKAVAPLASSGGLGIRAGSAKWQENWEDVQIVAYDEQDRKEARLADRTELIAKSTKERTSRTRVPAAKANKDDALVLLPEGVAVLPGLNWDLVTSDVKRTSVLSLFAEEIAAAKAEALARILANPGQRLDYWPSSGKTVLPTSEQKAQVDADLSAEARWVDTPEAAEYKEEVVRQAQAGLAEVWKDGRSKSGEARARRERRKGQGQETEELAGAGGEKSKYRGRRVCSAPEMDIAMGIEGEKRVVTETAPTPTANGDADWVLIPKLSPAAPTTTANADAEENASSDSDSDIEIDIDFGVENTAENGKADEKARRWWW